MRCDAIARCCGLNNRVLEPCEEKDSEVAEVSLSEGAGHMGVARLERSGIHSWVIKQSSG